MKKILLSLIVAVMVLLPMSVNAEGKVKVYIFEAGGCPYCEAEIEYLESLDGYGEKFEIVRKELYVDHVEWEEGKDYALGVQVAETFLQAGFEDASYEGTPFVVISDLYAAAAYSQNLEEVIDTAYKQGDKDVVGCIAAGKSNCLEGTVTPTVSPSDEKTKDSDVITLVILGVVVVGIAALVFFTRRANKEEARLDRIFAMDDDAVTVKKEAKKTEVEVEETQKATKKTVSKKSAAKTKKPATKRKNK